MEAASRGAQQAGGTVVGLLPGTDRSRGERVVRRDGRDRDRSCAQPRGGRLRRRRGGGRRRVGNAVRDRARGGRWGARWCCWPAGGWSTPPGCRARLPTRTTPAEAVALADRAGPRLDSSGGRARAGHMFQSPGTRTSTAVVDADKGWSVWQGRWRIRGHGCPSPDSRRRRGGRRDDRRQRQRARCSRPRTRPRRRRLPAAVATPASGRPDPVCLRGRAGSGRVALRQPRGRALPDPRLRPPRAGAARVREPRRRRHQASQPRAAPHRRGAFHPARRFRRAATACA